jgi:SAM-dependent methyltransferase
MSDWGGGYVTDAAYVRDYCRAQIPPMLALGALAAGVVVKGGKAEAIAYCDLGCGQGLTANLIAASNPQARVWGFDFNPAHIANASALAEAAGLQNVSFHEASFGDLAEDAALPAFDIIATHGVISWIAPEHRKALVAFVARQLKPGGLFYVSYDCMPGWAGLAPLRNVLARAFAPRSGLKSPAALERALEFADALRAADARFHKVYPNVEAEFERLKNTPRAYLVHELLPRHWEAFTFGELAEELAAAKLVFLGSAYLPDGVERVSFTEKQQAFLAGLDDPILVEEAKDLLLSRQFRRDIFIKGRPEASAARQRASWLDTRFALTVPPEEFELNFVSPLGAMQLREDIHGPLVAALREGPTTLREALARAPEAAAHWLSLVDAIKILVGRGDVHPALPAENAAERQASTRAFNDAVLARAMEGGDERFLASPVIGGGVRVDRLTQLFLLARRRGLADPAKEIAALAEAAAPPDADGAPAGEDARRSFGQNQAARILERVAPALARLGVE